MRIKLIFTTKQTKLLCLVLFIVLSILTAPYPFLMIGLHDIFPVCIKLLERVNKFSVMYILELVSLRVVPMLVIAVLTICIVYRVLVSKNVGENENKIKKDQNIQMTIILILISTSYILLYLPVIIHFVLLKLNRYGIISISKEGMEIGQKSTRPFTCGYAINFYLYIAGSKLFCKLLKRAVCLST